MECFIKRNDTLTEKTPDDFSCCYLEGMLLADFRNIETLVILKASHTLTNLLTTKIMLDVYFFQTKETLKIYSHFDSFKNMKEFFDNKNEIKYFYEETTGNPIPLITHESVLLGIFE